MIRLITFVSILVTALGGFGLYRLKYQVQALDRQVDALQEQVQRDRDAVRILQAEWVYLTRPQRLQELAGKYLALKPAAATQIAMSIDSVPMKSTALAADTAPAAPPASALPHLQPGAAMHAISFQGQLGQGQ